MPPCQGTARVMLGLDKDASVLMERLTCLDAGRKAQHSRAEHCPSPELALIISREAAQRCPPACQCTSFMSAEAKRPWCQALRASDRLSRTPSVVMLQMVAVYLEGRDVQGMQWRRTGRRRARCTPAAARAESPLIPD